MNDNSELERVAAAYRGQGFTVVTRPTADDLPPFARDFDLEIVGRRGGEGVLLIVKQTRDDLAAMVDAPRYAEVTGSQPGWRLDLVVLGDNGPAVPDRATTSAVAGVDVGRSAERAERLIGSDYTQMAIVAAWAAFEPVSRLHLRRLGPRVDRDTRSADVARELYSAGLVSREEFSVAQSAYRLVREVVHGLPLHGVEATPEYATVVRELAGTARRLSGGLSITPQPA